MSIPVILPVNVCWSVITACSQQLRFVIRFSFSLMKTCWSLTYSFVWQHTSPQTLKILSLSFRPRSSYFWTLSNNSFQLFTYISVSRF